MQDRTREILTDLERVRENLLALSDDIWLGIDHNNSEALNEGVRFKQAFNEAMAAFAAASTQLSVLIQGYTRVPAEAEVTGGPGQKGKELNERLIRELDAETPHYLHENFSYKRPSAFVLQTQPYKDVSSWRHLYQLVCQQLYSKDQSLFVSLPNHPEFKGKKSFTTEPQTLIAPIPIGDRLYAEGNRSAWDITQQIRRLLHIFGIPDDQMVIYLSAGD